MNRGVEIDSVIADDHDRSLITTQVEMGVAARMAVLRLWRYPLRTRWCVMRQLADKCAADLSGPKQDETGWLPIEDGKHVDSGTGAITVYHSR